MKTDQLHLYTIMPLDTAHIDEICEDVYEQYQNGVATAALFCMKLVPEGDPPVDKANAFCEKYRLFQKKLAEKGLGSGVLVQATIGHGWKLGEMFPFQQYIGFRDGSPENTVCPYDTGFHDYIREAMRTIAACHPDSIMVDDDFRLMFRQGGGCACPIHMARFCEKAGEKITREQLWEIVCSDTAQGRRYADWMVELQKEALLSAAKAMRAGIDAVDPTIPGSYCCCGNNVEFADEIAAILAGKGNPTVVRINNGNYTPAGARYFSRAFLRAAHQIAKLKDRVDVLLAETDTCPQNRYSTGAMSLHTHFTGTILEGAKGAKHWITRLNCFEPASGRAYRRVLGGHRGFYEALAALEPQLHWRGFRIPVHDTPSHTFGKPFEVTTDGADGWSSCVLERFGLPLYFSAKPGGVVCMEGKADEAFTDQEILEFLKGPVFLASDTAARLIQRGFAEYLGVLVRPWCGKSAMGERFLFGGHTKTQQKLTELVPTSYDTTANSYVYWSDGVQKEDLFPGTTVYKNKLGGTVFVFSGTPLASFTIQEAFSFLTESRKRQITAMLESAGECPVYYPGDAEVYLRAADLPDGGLFCAFFNIGLDPIEQIELVIDRPVESISYLNPEGNWCPVSYSAENGRYTLELSAGVLNPVMLMMR